MYLREIRANWRPLLAACVGIAMGVALSYYTTSLFGPPLLAEFGWSRAQYALMGTLPLLTVFLVPLAGRFTDRFGARTAATIGFVALPIGYLALSAMSGDITEFFVIWTVQQILAILTTAIVFCRVIVERFDAARGIALSIAMSAPPLASAIATPLLGHVIETEGWRAGYQLLALVTAAGGLTAIIALGRYSNRVARQAAERHLSRKELGHILRDPTFLLVVCGMFLVNVPQVFAMSQMKLVLMDGGVTSATATWMLSLYAMGIIVGRILSGLALDRMEAHLVGIAALGLPALGYLIFAAQLTAAPILTLAVLVIGFAQGAESDVGAYILSRRFEMKNFSLLLSLLTATISIATAVGSIILSFTLGALDSYVPFLLVSAVSTAFGALMFGLTGSRRAKLA